MTLVSRFSMRVACSLAVTLACAAAVPLVVAARAQQVPPSAQQERQAPPVTFKVEVNYVEVDAAVVDRQGSFVRDLSSRDFQLLEDGKEQKISTFSFVNIPIERIEKPLFAARPIEPDVQTNAGANEGRIYLLVLDDLHTAMLRSQLVQAAARRFVERQMGANDQVAIVCTSGRTAAAQEFTSNRQLLLDAIGRFMGRKLRSPTLERLEQYSLTRDSPAGVSTDDMLETERAYNARSAFDTLRRLSDYMASVHGRRKAVIYISEGVDYNVSDPINNKYATDIREAAQDAVSAATRGNVSIYAIDPRGLTDMGDEGIQMGSLPDDPSLGLGPQSMMAELRLSQESLQYIADETGGFAAINSNDFGRAFDRIVQESSSYYVLGYYPSNDRRDGKFRKIDVRVNRPGVTAHFRRGYVAPSGKAAARRPVEHEAITSAEVREALESPIPIAGFVLAASAAPFKGTAPKSSVVITVQGRGSDLKFSEKPGAKPGETRFEDLVELTLIAVDHDGKISSGDQVKMNMSLRPENRPLVQQAGFRTVSRLELAPGRYQLRVAARDTNGARIGSVYYDLAVPDFWKAPLSMSGLVVASRRGAVVPTPRKDAEIEKALPGPPTTAREFLSDDELAVLAEVYDNQASTAHKVNITTTIVADEGRTVFRHADERASSELAGKRGGYGYVVRIPLKDIPPGLYVLKIEARSTLGKTDPVSREVQFRVWPAPAPKSPPGN